MCITENGLIIKCFYDRDDDQLLFIASLSYIHENKNYKINSTTTLHFNRNNFKI